MTKLTLTVELDYDKDLMHGDDPEAIEWFYNDILLDPKSLLFLHSEEIGDIIGTLKIKEVRLNDD